MKNRKRETCTSGTVRDEDGNILIYSARWSGSQCPFLGAERTSRRRTYAARPRMQRARLRMPPSATPRTLMRTAAILPRRLASDCEEGAGEPARSDVDRGRDWFGVGTIDDAPAAPPAAAPAIFRVRSP
jgi:hypothetical protein